MVAFAYLFFSAISGSLKGFNYFFMSTKDVDELKQKIISDSFIPENTDVNDIVFDEILLTSWDINSRTPRFFSKWSNKNQNLFEGDEK